MITGHRWETDASERGEGFGFCLIVADPGRCAFDPNDAMVASQPPPHVLRWMGAAGTSARTRGVLGSCKVDVRLEREMI